ncbi:hypothetical protein [Mycobacterium sp. AZCC_0083]|uniref:hypothetical protein n=1 Tax=Mycobacterium sp. AZCC_0083 TaxID=2735882 RepID=UPI00160731E8|nr:hypothetical protein [Mycobacterium sp. AZCC_0083]MBB5161716.1 hypothetical protein [Mycobacterium sp. AZCC_0083]
MTKRCRAVAILQAKQAALGLIDAGLDCRHGDLATCPHFPALAGRVDRPSTLTEAILS